MIGVILRIVIFGQVYRSLHAIVMRPPNLFASSPGKMGRTPNLLVLRGQGPRWHRLQAGGQRTLRPALAAPGADSHHVGSSKPLSLHLVSHVSTFVVKISAWRIRRDSLRPLRAVQFVQQPTAQIFFFLQSAQSLAFSVSDLRWIRAKKERRWPDQHAIYQGVIERDVVFLKAPAPWDVAAGRAKKYSRTAEDAESGGLHLQYGPALLLKK